jgi:gliding motility-associated-like protein
VKTIQDLKWQRMIKKLLLNISLLIFAGSALYGQFTIDSITSTPVTCGGYTNGTVSVFVSGGSGNGFIYRMFEGVDIWQDGSSDSTFTFNLGHKKSDFYIVMVYDSSNLTSPQIVPNISIGGPDVITISSPTSFTTDMSCATINDGTIFIDASGEAGDLKYVLSGDDTGISYDGNFSILGTGTYTVTVTDNTGLCPSSDVEAGLFIDIPPALTIPTITITDVECFGDATGSIEITAAGGTPNAIPPDYNYLWTGAGISSFTLEDQVNLIKGNDYEVTVTDGNGCQTSSGLLTVDEAAEIIMTVSSSDDVTCNGGSDGKVNISLTGGVNPVDFVWTGNTTSHLSIKRNPDDLIADEYKVLITDKDGCSRTYDPVAVISEPDPISAVLDSAIDVTCFSDTDGKGYVTVNGGTGPYSYSWDDPASSILEDPINLPPGTYSLDVTDSEGCPTASFPGIVIIGEPNDITAIPGTTTDALCFDSSNGTALVTVAEGTPGYSYLWTGTNPANSSIMPNPTDLHADTYELKITDANLCEKTFGGIVTIGEPADITVAPIDIVNILCNDGATGSISINPSGGTTPYTFVWDGPLFTSGLEDISGLKTGTYNLTITDNHSCTKDFNGNDVVENTSITASFIPKDLTCNAAGDGEIATTVGGGVAPYSYSWRSEPAGYTNTTDEDLTSLDAANYILTVTDNVTCSQEFLPQTVSQPDPLVAAFSSSDATCYGSDDGTIDIVITGGTGPYTTAWTGPNLFSSLSEDISGLEPGEYTLNLSDANTCNVLYTAIVTITEPDYIVITATATDISCEGENNGEITTLVTGGTGPYIYDWDGPAGYDSNQANITGLVEGDYDLLITDAKGCILDSNAVAHITEPSAIVVTFNFHTDLDCFGDSDGSIDISAVGGVAPLSFIWRNSGGVVVSTVANASGLIAGTYSLEVTDLSSCVVTYPDAVIIDEPTALTSSLSTTDVVCYSQTNGSITVLAAGGTPAYNYSLNGAPPVAGNVFPGLGKGFYTVDTRDTKGCVSSGLIEVKEPAQITFSDYGVSGQNDCYGDSSATIYINTINGGVTPYEYSINGGGTYHSNNSFPNIPGGIYDFRVKDANNCETVISSNLKVDEPFEIKITNYIPVHVTTCYENPEGQITLTASGGSGSLNFSNDGGATTQISPLFTNLLGGVYDLQIIDDNSCSNDTTVVINRPAKLVIDDVIIDSVTGCTGDSNGQLEAIFIGGTGAVQFSLNAIDYQGPIFPGLLAGDYTITAQDTESCTTDTLVTIYEPDPITFTTETATDADCNSTSTGSVSVVAAGGTLPYTYSISPAVSIPQANGLFVGLPADDYTVSVNDAGGCGPIVSTILTVGEPTAIVVDSVTTDFISCNGAGNAEIRVYMSGGTPPYQYSFDNEGSYESSSAKTGLIDGTYDVWVKDANDCSLFVDSYTFINPSAISLTATLTHVSPCFGGTNGAISATASGGWESFEYSINGADYFASGDFSGLAAGDYTIFTLDTGNCSSTINITITEPDSVTATITKTDYVDDVLGTITISSASGGVPPYDYSIDGLTGTFTLTTSYIHRIAGTYDVVVRDASACTYEETIEIYDILPLTMVIDSSDVSCFGEDDGFIEFQPQDAVGEVFYSIDNSPPSLTTALFENLPGNIMYIMRAQDEDGKIFWDSVYISEPTQLIVNSIQSPANCNAFSETGAADITVSGGTGGYTYNWSNDAIIEDLINVVAGNYSVTVSDNSGCSVSEDIFISAFIIIDADAGKDTTICQGETIILEGKPGDVVLWEPSDYLSNQGISDPVAVNVIDSITYTYTETETSSPYSCYDIDTLTISVLPTVGIDVTQDTVALEGQLIQLETTGGPFVSFSWIPVTGLNATDISDPIATGQSSILYYVNGTNEYGCIETDSVQIDIIENITVYNAFSPNNGDDINQYFEIDNAAGFPQMLVEVYNRWGSRIFSSVGYSDDKRWDGTSRGKDVPIGTYYYIIIPYPDATPITGNVTIIR